MILHRVNCLESRANKIPLNYLDEPTRFRRRTAKRIIRAKGCLSDYISGKYTWIKESAYQQSIGDKKFEGLDIFSHINGTAGKMKVEIRGNFVHVKIS
jgi:hypothetical protein